MEENEKNISEEEANELFKEFSKIKNCYTNIKNPFNYLLKDKNRDALNMDEKVCFYGKLKLAMDNVNGEKEYEYKNNAINAIENTNKFIEDNIIPQLHGIVILSKLATNKCFKFENSIKQELEEDIELKVNVFEQLKQKLREAQQEIEGVLNNDKAKVFSNYKGIKNLTTDYTTYGYLLDLGVKCYYTIDIEIEKDYWGIFCCMFLGVLQVVGGVMLKSFTGNDFGLIREGFSDIKFGFECLIGKKQFSWKAYGEKKKAFLVNLAINLVVGYFSGNLTSVTNNSDNNIKDLLIETGKYALKEGINAVAENMIGKDLIKKIFNKVKEYINLNSQINKLLDEICNNLFDNQIFDKIICMDALIDSKNNINNFNNKLKIALNKIYKFSNSLSTIIKVFKSIIDTIKSSENGLIKLAEIFKTTITNISGLSESISILTNFLSNLKGEILGVLENQTQGFFDKINNFEDYINKKLIGTNCDDLFDILKKII